MKTSMANNIMPPNSELMIMPAISALVRPCDCESDSLPVLVGVTIVVGDMISVIDGVIDVVGTAMSERIRLTTSII